MHLIVVIPRLKDVWESGEAAFNLAFQPSSSDLLVLM